MTDITELAKSLKAAAENAGADCWQAKKISGDFYVIRKGSYKRQCGYTTYQPIAEIDHKPTRDYVAMANPTNILALVEALEKAKQRNGELETYSKTALEFREAARDENRHLKLELEIAEKRITELESRTVKLPQRLQPGADGYDDWYVHSDDDGEYLKFDDVLAMLTAAGIKVEAE